MCAICRYVCMGALLATTVSHCAPSIHLSPSPPALDGIGRWTLTHPVLPHCSIVAPVLQTHEITQLKGQVQASIAAPRTPSPSALPPGVVAPQQPGDKGAVAINAGPLAFAPAAPGVASGGFGTLRSADADGRAPGASSNAGVLGVGITTSARAPAAQLSASLPAGLQ